MKEKKYKITFSPSAERDIEKFAVHEAIHLVKDIRIYLETSPFPFGKRRLKKLRDYYPPLYRLRSGDFRAYHRVLPGEVVILAITHRKDSEKLLKKLK